MKKLIKLLIILAIVILSQISYACDMSAFEQTEFSERCQRLIDFCQKAYITVISEHPDADKRLSEMSKDWIDFYLSHGNRSVQPPNMAFISADIWERNLKELGNKFSDFLNKKIDAKTFQDIILELNLFKSEEKLSQLHNCFKASEVCETDISKIENLELWISTRLLAPCSLIYEYEQAVSEDLVNDLNDCVENYIESVKKYNDTIKNSEKTKEEKQALFDEINNSIEKSLNQWEVKYFYK